MLGLNCILHLINREICLKRRTIQSYEVRDYFLFDKSVRSA
jgi:hypothetical protein